MRAVSPRLLRKSLTLLWLAAIVASCVPTYAQSGAFRDTLGLKGKLGGSKPLAKFVVELTESGTPGEAVLRIKATIPADHYIYSTNDNGGAETSIDVESVTGLVAIGKSFTADHAPKSFQDPALDRTVEKYYDHVTWSQRYRVEAGNDPANLRIKGRITYQICDKNTCRPNIKVPIDVTLAAAAAPELPAGPDADPTRTSAREEEEAPAKLGAEDTAAVADTGEQSAQSEARPEPEFRARLRPGAEPDEMLLEIRVTIPPDFHIYSTEEKGAARTEISIDKVAGLEPLDEAFQSDHPPVVVEETDLDGKPVPAEHFVDTVTWTKRFRKLANASAVPPVVRGIINYQICGGGVRRLKKQPFSTEAGAPEKLAMASVPAGVKPGSPAGAGAGYKAQGLPAFLIAAFGAGFLALLTPCVFPMVPITVSFFQKQSEKQHHRPVTMASVYCLGIIATFTILGLVMSILFGPGALKTIANNSWLNLFIAGVLVFFGLNLLGMFELRMPGWLLTYSANQEGRGGFIGVLFMALTFTLTSFTCTFAFVGALLVYASQGDRIWPTLGLLAFSTAFSLPFFFLALFPSILQRLPRSGGWMNVVKVLMGLIEIGAAFKFFNAADLSWNGQAVIFDYHVVMSAWMITSIAAGMYLLGTYRLPHDVPTENIGVVRFLTAMSFLGLASYLSVGLFGTEKPQGKVWQYIAAFAAPQFHLGTDPIGPYSEHGGLKYALDFERAMEFAIEKNQPLFLDFTGVNCTNCRYMENGTMSRPEIEDRLRNFVRVQLFTDVVPIPDVAEANRIYAYNVQLQERWFGDVTLPSYVVIPPDRAALEDTSRILANLEGARSETEFATFLDLGLSRWRKIQASRPGNRAVGQR
jgi:thiol:disulfide interchange protein DsbD